MIKKITGITMMVALLVGAVIFGGYEKGVLYILTVIGLIIALLLWVGIAAYLTMSD